MPSIVSYNKSRFVAEQQKTGDVLNIQLQLPNRRVLLPIPNLHDSLPVNRDQTPPRQKPVSYYLTVMVF